MGHTVKVRRHYQWDIIWPVNAVILRNSRCFAPILTHWRHLRRALAALCVGH
jgi:hypothetical protein